VSARFRGFQRSIASLGFHCFTTMQEFLARLLAAIAIEDGILALVHQVRRSGLG
jgi:hypothetical protein